MPRVHADRRHLSVWGWAAHVVIALACATSCLPSCSQAAEPTTRQAPGGPWFSRLASLWEQVHRPEVRQVLNRVSGFVSIQPQGRFPALGNVETWKRLPPTEYGSGEPLPLWARVLASSLPRTTAAMLEFDYCHRAQSTLDPMLRGEIRWEAAHSIGCRYGEAYAAADLRRAGMLAPGLLARDDYVANRPAAERAVLQFARKLSVASETITDEEVSFLIAHYGEKPVVAIVELIAYANFLDRMVMALGLPVEAGGPCPPVKVRFTNQAWDRKDATPRRRSPVTPTVSTAIALPSNPDWEATPLAQLQQAMRQQQTRKPRIKLPQTDGTTVRWGLVGRTYQPQLHAAWTACSSSFEREADQDPVLRAHLLWVITRSVHCYY